MYRIDIRFSTFRGTKAPFPSEEQVGARIHAESVMRGLFSRVRGDVFPGAAVRDAG